MDDKLARKEAGVERVRFRGGDKNMYTSLHRHILFNMRLSTHTVRNTGPRRGCGLHDACAVRKALFIQPDDIGNMPVDDRSVSRRIFFSHTVCVCDARQSRVLVCDEKFDSGQWARLHEWVYVVGAEVFGMLRRLCVFCMAYTSTPKGSLWCGCVGLNDFVCLHVVKHVVLMEKQGCEVCKKACHERVTVIARTDRL